MIIKRLHIGAALFGVLANTAYAQPTGQPSMSITPGGSVDVTVPEGTARAVALDLTNVIDPTGSVASFRIETSRGTRPLESRRMTFYEPGGSSTQHFTREFDRIRISDDEGGLVATITNVTFCSIAMVSANNCVVRRGTAESQKAMGEDELGATSGVGGPTRVVAVDPVITSPGGGGAGEPTAVVVDVTPVGTTTSGSSDDATTVSQPIRQAQGVSVGPYHGETTPITPMDRVVVQAGVHGIGSFMPYTPWIDQAVMSKTWSYRERGDEILPRDEIQHNEWGMPIFPEDHDSSGRAQMISGALWMGTSSRGDQDVAGTWRITYDERIDLELWLRRATIIGQTDTSIDFRCEEGSTCAVAFELNDSPADARRPVIVQLTDRHGRQLTDAEDLENGLLTRENFRRALYGYGEFRPMVSSGATATAASVIRFDEFPDLEYGIWAENAPKVDFGRTAGLASIETGTGMRHSFLPLEARLQAAWELGSVYHHNFPHLFLEHRENFDPAVIEEWFEELWADPSISEESKLAILNDYELQHVDEFGAEVVRNQHLLVDNQIKVEVSNETWNFGFPWNIQAKYYQRRAAWIADQMGRDVPTGARAYAVQTGYDLTKSIARLRRQYPEVEWRGVMAVQTSWIGTNRTGSHPAPETENDYYNPILHGLITGMELFWEDYDANQGEWAELYAPRPEQPGDWFEVHGTTYYKILSTLPDMKAHLGGIPTDEFLGRIESEDDWPALRHELLEFFMDESTDRGSITDPRGSRKGPSSLGIIRQTFETLVEHASVYGMQVGSYEGGNHASLGGYFANTLDDYPQVQAFWRDFHDSVELGLIQAAVHDAAVNAGWMTLADYAVFEGETDFTIFGTRKSFEDLTPVYCEYARWMPANPEVPRGLEGASDLLTPHQRCGAMIDFFNQARSQNYYVGRQIPAAEDLLP